MYESQEVIATLMAAWSHRVTILRATQKDEPIKFLHQKQSFRITVVLPVTGAADSKFTMFNVRVMETA